MLVLDHVNLSLGSFSLTADFSISAGARVAVMGPSGAGKSSLLLAIAGFIAPISGRILWGGQDLTTLDPAQRPISMLFQDQNLFPHLTLLQNVVLGLTAGRRAAAAQLAQAEAALAKVGLSGYGNRTPAQVSGGQMGRAALARVLLQASPILLLDEPFAALDSDLRHQMLDLVVQVAAQTDATILMVTHDERDAARFASHLITVDHGVAQPPRST
jgi:thiamine transport system ATP-binding protein